MKSSAIFGLAGALLLGLSAASAAAEDYKIGALTLSHPHSRATPGAARVGAGFLTIRNDGDAADRLVSVACACAETSEIHQMKMENGMMMMAPLSNGLPIPAGETVELKPGGFHLMFIGLKAPFEADKSFTATLTFERAGSVDATFKIGPLRGGQGHKSH